MENDFTESAKYFYLLDTLAPKVKDRIGTVTRDCREIWDQLDNIYGKEDTLEEMVASELFNIKASDCGEDYIIKLSTGLEETEVLLSQHDQMEWLTSKPVVKLLKDKLSPKEKEERAIQMDTFVGTKYERLKQFLHARRMVAERLKAVGMQKASSKKDGAEVCMKDRCSRKGHKSQTVQPRRTAAVDLMTGSATTEPGHLSWACPTLGGEVGSKGQVGGRTT